MKLRDFLNEFKYVEPRDEAHYRQLMKDLQDIQKDPKQYATVGKMNFMKRKAALDAWADKHLKNEDMAAEPAKCTHCNGTGKHGDKECSVCGGRGFVTEDASGEEEDEFHRKLDKLVHKTFGHSSDEKKNKKDKHAKEDGVQPTDMKRVGAMGKTLYVHKDGKTIMIPAEREKEFIAKGFKRSALRTEETNEGEMRMDKTAFVQMLANKIKEPQKGYGRKEYDNRLLAKMYELITGQDVDFQGDKFTINVNKPQTEDIDYRSEDILNKAGFDPADIDTYMKVFNDHGDTSDIKQMNMKEKIGLADAMSIVLASHGISNEAVSEDADIDAQFKSDVLQFLNLKVAGIERQIQMAPAKTQEEKENKEFALKLFDFVQKKLEQKDDGNNTLTVPKSMIKKENSVNEGASMIPYFKTEKDWDGEKRVVWEFPKTWANDKELDTPYMSNASMRQFLTALGYPADFEDMSAVPIDEFIGVSTQWLKKNIGKQSPEEEPTVDKNPGGPTMISGGRPEGYMNQQVKLHNELARKIKAKYPEVTHLGFN